MKTLDASSSRIVRMPVLSARLAAAAASARRAARAGASGAALRGRARRRGRFLGGAAGACRRLSSSLAQPERSARPPLASMRPRPALLARPRRACSVLAAPGFSSAALALSFGSSLRASSRTWIALAAFSSALSLLDDRYASVAESSMNSAAMTTVSRVRKLPAPAPPNTVWLEPPKRRAHAAAAPGLQQHDEDQEDADDHVDDGEKRDHGRLSYGFGRRDDGGKRVGVERGAADQRAVDVRLGQQRARVVGFDAAAVEDAQPVGQRAALQRGRPAARIARVHLLRVRRARRPAGADRPDRLVGDHQPRRRRASGRPSSAAAIWRSTYASRSRRPRALRGSRRRRRSGVRPARAPPRLLAAHVSSVSPKSAAARSGRRSRSCSRRP